MKLEVKGGNQTARISVSEHIVGSADGIFYLDVTMTNEMAEVPEPFKVRWQVPSVDCYSVWSPQHRNMRSLGVNWSMKKTKSRLASSMPIQLLVSASGRNRLNVSLSDAATPISIGMGIIEENGNFLCEVEFFTQPTTPIDFYNALIRIDTRDVMYYDSIYDTVSWWENECGYISAPVPEHARLPMNSLWYSFHQKLDVDEIVRQCALSKPIGMDTVIVDDGWQTDDNNRGYAYCGDWEVAASKIPDMKELVRRVHETGMKFILWYSVPAIGVRSRAYERFKDMLLERDGDWKPIDPRYKEAREYLVKLYTDAVRDWELDGLKLDFIDSFALRGASLIPDERRDYQSLEDAVDALMREITESLKTLNPDILIEFRQSYVGPVIRKYGNMLRVGDCPNCALLNRCDVINLRLTSGKTAVHSDMVMWNYDDTVESAALQLASIIYSVPQISMLIDKLSPDHREMLEFYLSFWRANRDVLLDGKLTALSPESSYSSAASEMDGEKILSLYTDSVVEQYDGRLTVVNASGNTSIIFKGFSQRGYIVLDCMGNTVEEGSFDACAISELYVPVAGMVIVD